MKPHPPTPCQHKTLRLFFALLAVFLINSFAQAQEYHNKINSGELHRLIVEEPESERLVIIFIKTDKYIKELQLKSIHKSPYANISYTDRANLALNHELVSEAFKSLSQYGTPGYNQYQTKESFKNYKTHYYLFLNAFAFKVKVKNLPIIEQLPFVERIHDGEAQIPKINYNTLDRKKVDNNSFQLTKNKTNRIDYWELLIMNEWDYAITDVLHLHEMNYKGQGIKISIIDSGISYDNPAINMYYETNQWDNGKLNVKDIFYYEGDGQDTIGHGTNVAGIAWKMAPWSSFYIAKMGNTYDDLVNTINWSLSHEVDIINTSFNFIHNNDGCPSEISIYDELIESANNQKTMTVTSAGNAGNPSDDSFPVANYPSSPGGYGTNSLSAYGICDNFGAGPIERALVASPVHPCPEYSIPNVAAPGMRMTSLSNHPEFVYTSQPVTGSSFSTAIITGIASLLKQVAVDELAVHNNATIVRESILNSLIPFVDQFYPGEDGYINALWAYDKMLEIPPDIAITSPSNNSTVSGMVNIAVDASDEHSGMDYVEIWIGGVKKATITQPPYSYQWNTDDNNPGNIQIMAKAFDNVGNSSSHSVTVNIQATVVSLYNGYVTPSTGFTGETYSFKVSYKNTNGIPPDPNSVKIHIAGTNYAMNAGGSNWASGVEFSKDLIVNNPGNYNYYFTATVDGVNLRNPTSGYLNLSVTQNADGWDARVTEVTASTYQFTGSTNITFTGKVHNNSNSPDKIYYNLPYDFKVFNPSGDLINSESGTIAQINQHHTETVNATFNFASSLPNGVYQTVLTIYPSLDSNPNNNTNNVNFIKGSEGAVEQFHVTSGYARLWMDIDNTDTIFPPNSNTTWSIVNIQSNRIRFSRNAVIQNWIYTRDFRTYDGGTVMISCHYTGNIPHDWAEVSFGSANQSVITYDNTVISGYPGQQVHFTVNTNNNTFNNSNPDFFRDNDGLEDWYSHRQRFNNNQGIRFFFNIPSNASTGHYDSYLGAYINSSDEHVLSKVRITVLQPTPVINSISSHNISADDQITISGSNFGTSTGQVKFNNLNGTIVSWSNTSITCIVPVGVTDGLLTVVNSGGTSNPMPYQVISSSGEPFVVNPIPDQSIAIGVSTYIANLNDVFDDPNNDPLTFSVSTSDPEISYDADELNSGLLYLMASDHAENVSNVIVTATDITDKSATDHFNVSLMVPPPIIDLVFPENYSIGLPTDLLFEWQPELGVNFYSLEISTDDAFENSEFYIYQIEETEYLISGLEYSTDYYWRVFAYNDWGNSPPSEVWSFQTQPPSPKINVMPALLDFDEVTIGDCEIKSYSLTGQYLSDEVVISAPLGFKISAQETTGFDDVISVPEHDGNVDQTIYVRFCPDEFGNYSGVIANESAGATAAVVDVSGISIGLISDIDVAQRLDGSGLIDVYYTLDAPDDEFNISLLISFDGGSTFEPVSIDHLEGDVTGVSPGSSKHIVWDGLAGFEGVFSTETMLDITAIRVYSLYLFAQPENTGNVSGEGLYEEGAEVSITAISNEGWEFVNWTGDTEHLDDVNSAEAVVTMPDYNVTLTAAFQEEDDSDIIYGDGVTDIDDNFYTTVIIGNQEWMAENLRTTRDADGNDITRYCYNNNTANCELYGGLYTWHTVMNGQSSSSSNPSGVQGICPTGWHVPSDAEWTELLNYLDSQDFPNSNVTDGAGNALKSCRQVDSPLGGDCDTSEHPRWNSHSTHYGFDEFGFSALPGGFRWSGGSFGVLGTNGSWWSSTENSSTLAWRRHLSRYGGNVFRLGNSKTYGFSLRCVRVID